jgi:hypothetical protein
MSRAESEVLGKEMVLKGAVTLHLKKYKGF